VLQQLHLVIHLNALAACLKLRILTVSLLGVALASAVLMLLLLLLFAIGFQSHEWIGIEAGGKIRLALDEGTQHFGFGGVLDFGCDERLLLEVRFYVVLSVEWGRALVLGWAEVFEGFVA